MTAAATADQAVAEKPKSKKLLFIILGVVLVALIGAGAALFILMKNTAENDDDYDDDGPVAQQTQARSKTPPVFLPLENMVVNLADAGGNRFVQVGITLQLQDSKTGDEMKVYMPSIRSAVLMLISERTSDEVLQLEGKTRLSRDIIRAISGIMGYDMEEEVDERSSRRRQATTNPVQAVLFSSFIVQ